MVARSLLACAAGMAIFSTAVSAAQAESDWRVRHGNGQMWAEAASVSHGSTLSVNWDDANSTIALNLAPTASWNGNAGYKLKLLVDGRVFPVVADGTDDGVVLSNLPREAIGIDQSLRNAMKAGRELVIEGPPAAGIPVNQRSFSLTGAESAISRIEASCAGVR